MLVTPMSNMPTETTAVLPLKKENALVIIKKRKIFIAKKAWAGSRSRCSMSYLQSLDAHLLHRGYGPNGRVETNTTPREHFCPDCQKTLGTHTDGDDLCWVCNIMHESESNDEDSGRKNNESNDEADKTLQSGSENRTDMTEISDGEIFP